MGSHLIRDLLSREVHVLATGTSRTHPLSQEELFTYIQADTSKPGLWQEELKTVDGVVNLAGRNIFHSWTEEYKKSIYESRILTTRNLVQGLDQGRNIAFLSASAVGFYGDRGEEGLDEEATPGDDFLARLSRDWEAEANKAGEKGARVGIMRFGIVLGKGGGALSKMLLPFKFGLGGRLGSGRHWISWIHIQDLAAATWFLLENKNLAGPFNFCAPNPVQNMEFSKTLGQVLGRPTLVRTPALALRLALGELGRTLLSSQRATPKRLKQAGFSFQYPDLRFALETILRGKQAVA